jgi:hypothetical protein
MSTGWTFDQVAEQFDLLRLKAMIEYWKHKPPVHVMIASYLGIDGKPTQKFDDPEQQNSGLIDALNAFQQG